MHSKKINIIIIIISAVVILGFALFIDSPERIFSLLFSEISIPLFLLAVVCIFMYWLLEAVVLHMISKPLYPKQKFSDSFSVSMLGQLFNCITPFASGGQPIQAYRLIKTGMPAGIATAALICKFIVYQAALTLYCTVVLLFQYAVYADKIPKFNFLIILGYSINFAIMFFLISLGIFPKFTKKITDKFIVLLGKLKIVKNTQATLTNIDNQLFNFYNSFKLLSECKKTLVKMFLTSLLQLTFFFAIPYFIFVSLGVYNLSNLWGTICVSACILMITSYVPLPGASGGAEGGFVLFFNIVYNDIGLVSAAMLLWRLLTFYLPILAGNITNHLLLGKDKKE